MTQLVSEITTEEKILADRLSMIDARCNKCNKQFKSVRAITMQLKVKGANHAVTFVDHGNYDKNTGLRRMKRGSI